MEINHNILGGEFAKCLPVPSLENIATVIYRKFPTIEIYVWCRSCGQHRKVCSEVLTWWEFSFCPAAPTGKASRDDGHRYSCFCRCVFGSMRRNQSVGKAQSSFPAVSYEYETLRAACSRTTEVERASRRLRLLTLRVRLRKNSYLTEIADQVKGYPEGDDILEEEQPQETHVPHVAYPVNGNDRIWGRYDHRAGYKKHDARDEPPYDAGLRLPITRDHLHGGSNLGKTD